MTQVIPLPRRSRDADTFVRAAEIARRWGVSRETVYRIASRELPCFKFGPRTKCYRWDDVLHYEQTHRLGG